MPAKRNNTGDNIFKRLTNLQMHNLTYVKLQFRIAKDLIVLIHICIALHCNTKKYDIKTIIKKLIFFHCNENIYICINIQ